MSAGTPRTAFKAPQFPRFDTSGAVTPVPFATDPTYGAQPGAGPSVSGAYSGGGHAPRPHKLGGAAEASQMKRMKAMRNAADAQANALRGAVLTQLRQEAGGMKAIQVRCL